MRHIEKGLLSPKKTPDTCKRTTPSPCDKVQKYQPQQGPGRNRSSKMSAPLSPCIFTAVLQEWPTRARQARKESCGPVSLVLSPAVEFSVSLLLAPCPCDQTALLDEAEEGFSGFVRSYIRFCHPAALPLRSLLGIQDHNLLPRDVPTSHVACNKSPNVRMSKDVGGPDPSTFSGPQDSCFWRCARRISHGRTLINWFSDELSKSRKRERGWGEAYSYSSGDLYGPQRDSKAETCIALGGVFRVFLPLYYNISN